MKNTRSRTLGPMVVHVHCFAILRTECLPFLDDENFNDDPLRTRVHLLDCAKMLPSHLSLPRLHPEHLVHVRGASRGQAGGERRSTGGFVATNHLNQDLERIHRLWRYLPDLHKALDPRAYLFLSLGWSGHLHLRECPRAASLVAIVKKSQKAARRSAIFPNRARHVFGSTPTGGDTLQDGQSHRIRGNPWSS